MCDLVEQPLLEVRSRPELGCPVRRAVLPPHAINLRTHSVLTSVPNNADAATMFTADPLNDGAFGGGVLAKGAAFAPSAIFELLHADIVAERRRGVSSFAACGGRAQG